MVQVALTGGRVSAERFAMTEERVAVSSPSCKSNSDPVERTAAVQPEAGGLMKSVTKLVMETALEEDMCRAPGIRQALGRGSQPAQLPQWQAAGDGAD